MIPMMPTIPDSGAISGKPEDTSPTSAATPKSAYTTSVVEISDAEGAAGGAGASVIFLVSPSFLYFFCFATARAQRLLARLADEHDLAGEHIDELVFERVPVAERRLAAGAQRDQIDAELGETAGLAQAALDPITHARTEWFRIARPAHFRHRRGIEGGQLQRGHDFLAGLSDAG